MTLPTIFISHSSQDSEWCRCFATTLRQLGFDVWYDEHDIHGGSDWFNTIQTQLVARDCFIVILSPDAWNSPWVQREVELAYIKKHRILPVLHRPTQVTGFLETIQMINAVDRDCSTAARMISDLLLQKPAAPPAPPLPKTLQRLGFSEQEAENARFVVPPLSTVAAGAFIMGSNPRADPGAEEDETPQHQVVLGAYQIGTFPVTVAEYAYAVRVGAVLEPPRTQENPQTWQQQMQHLDHPVVGVDWLNARAYARWLTSLSTTQWHLPSEAQWEKAARGTDGRIFPWGNVMEQGRANSSENRIGTTTAVGTIDNRSPCGAYDLAGNVWEWTLSQPLRYPYAPKDGRDSENDPRQWRIVRGGSWDSSARLARTAFRLMYDPETLTGDLGFRLCVG